MTEVFPSIPGELSQLEPLLVEYLLTPNEPTNQILKHIFQSGGKRVRPALFLMVCKAIGYEGLHRFPIASVCEYIHTASLLHDDVIDNSTLRRGKPTANSIWGDESSVLAGDLIYSAACRLMVKTGHLALIDTFAECIRFMSESELFQLELLWKKDTTVEQYKRVVSGKTAVLFEASCLTPCFLHENSAELVDCFKNFGNNLGFAFQVADDCLDYEGSAEDVGKALTADLAEGKVTLPLIFSLQNTTNSEFHETVENVLQLGECSAQQARVLSSGVREFGGLEMAKEEARNHCSFGLESLKKAEQILGNSQNKSSTKAALADLANLLKFVVDRRK